MTAPFEDREGWEMSVLALDGSVYLEQYENRDNVQYSYKCAPASYCP
jgi:RAT1-interacting protein